MNIQWNASSYTIVSKLIGLLLIAASLLQFHEFLTVYGIEEDVLIERWLSVTGLVIELILGLWLLVDLFPLVTWSLTLVCFVVFFGVSLNKALAGDSTCGCFGRIGLHPWLTLALDTLILAALVWAQPLERRVLHSAGVATRIAIFGMLVVAVIGGSILTVNSLRAARLEDEGEVVAGSPIVSLQPKRWVGQHFPLLKHIDVGSRLARGHWIVMVYHRDCSRCQQEMPPFVSLAHEWKGRVDAPRAALIELPPYDDSSNSSAGNTGLLRGRLNDATYCRVATPAFLRLVDGTVRNVTDTAGELTFSDEHNTPDSFPGSLPQRGEESLGMSFPDYRAARKKLFLREVACGPLSLIVALQELGCTVSEEEMDRLITKAGNHGTDMLQLKGLAEERGVHCPGRVRLYK